MVVPYPGSSNDLHQYNVDRHPAPTWLVIWMWFTQYFLRLYMDIRYMYVVFRYRSNFLVLTAILVCGCWLKMLVMNCWRSTRSFWMNGAIDTVVSNDSTTSWGACSPISFGWSTVKRYMLEFWLAEAISLSYPALGRQNEGMDLSAWPPITVQVFAIITPTIFSCLYWPKAKTMNAYVAGSRKF